MARAWQLVVESQREAESGAECDEGPGLHYMTARDVVLQKEDENLQAYKGTRGDIFKYKSPSLGQPGACFLVC